jgi:hypothetical protein
MERVEVGDTVDAERHGLAKRKALSALQAVRCCCISQNFSVGVRRRRDDEVQLYAFDILTRLAVL